MTVLITLTVAGADSGPFNLYSNLDGYTSAFETGVSKAALLAGYSSSLVPDFTTIIRVMSTGVCTNYIDIPVGLIPTTTTTTTVAPTTTTTSTTATPTTTTTTTSGMGPAGTIYVENNALSASVEDFSDITTSLVFPIGSSFNESGTHAGVNTSFNIDMLIINPVCITVYVDAIAVYSTSVTVSGIVTMLTGNISASAYIEVIISEGPC
jgi:hypothetical protein